MPFNEILQWVIGAIFGVLTVVNVILPVGGPLRLVGSTTDGLLVTPDDFVPSVRLVVFTDSHNKNDHVADAIDTAYALFDNDETYPGVDGFFGLGDFSSIGQEGDYVNYVATLKEHVREETPCINIHGNHEFKDDNYREYFIRNFGYDPDTVTEINGFSCIAFSGERGATEWTFTAKSLKWYSNAIKEAEAKANGKAVFTFQHPHPWGTVYGSTIWGDPQINFILFGHNSVVNFSGHSHFPMNDPRSINQTTYTAVGCGATATFELDKNYLPGQHPDGYDPASEMCIVEADNDGSVRIRGYDLLSDTYFCDYYIDDVNNQRTYAYTYRNMKHNDSAPVWDGDLDARAYKNEGGEWIISFNEAHSNFIVHEYKVTIRDSRGKKVFSDNFVDDYYVIDDDDTADFRIGTDTLNSGEEYTLTVRAESAYHKYSEKKTVSFIAE